MRFPELGRSQSYRVTLPALSGGVNYAVPPHLVEDHQLTAVRNLWFRGGQLQTRPGLRLCGGDYDAAYGGTFPHQQRVGEQVLLYDYGAVGGYAYFSAALVGEDGEVVDQSRATLTFVERGTGLSVTALLAVPVSAEAEESLSAFKVVLLASFSDGSTTPYGYGYDEEQEEYTLQELSPYIPTILMNGRPTASAGQAVVNGDSPEPANLLTGAFRATFTSTGEGGLYYALPKTGLQSPVTVSYTAPDGTVYTHTAEAGGTVLVESFTGADNLRLVVNLTTGIAHFIDARTVEVTALPASDAPNNVVFTAQVALAHRRRMPAMGVCTWFGGGWAGLSGGTRLFAAGDALHPNLMHWSGLNNPLYFPESNYAYVGENGKAITAFGKQGERLIIFKAGELYSTRHTEGYTVSAADLQNGAIMDPEAARAVFPLTQLHPTVGCDCPDTIQLCHNRLIWLNSDGQVYGLFTTDTYSERNVRALSGPIAPRLSAHTAAALKAAGAAELAEQYLLLVEDRVYVMDYTSAGVVSGGSYASDSNRQQAVRWHEWELGGSGLFDRREKPRLTVAGGQPLLVAAAPNGGLVLFRFEEGASDDYLYLMDGHNEDVAVEPRPIPCSFATKLFDFGTPERRKRVTRAYLQVSGEADTPITVTYRDDREGEGSETLFADGRPLSHVAPRCLTPNALRVREFGLQVFADGGMQVGRVILHYAMMGGVR